MRVLSGICWRRRRWIDLHPVETVPLGRLRQRIGGAFHRLVEQVEALLIDAQLPQHLGRQQRALLVEELVALPHQLAFVGKFERG